MVTSHIITQQSPIGTASARDSRHGDGATHGTPSIAGRPQWRKLFVKIADRTWSGAEVGVFLCGPTARAMRFDVHCVLSKFVQVSVDPIYLHSPMHR